MFCELQHIVLSLKYVSNVTPVCILGPLPLVIISLSILCGYEALRASFSVFSVGKILLFPTIPILLAKGTIDHATLG